MPRKPAVPHAILINLIEIAKDNIVNECGSICGPTAKIWTELSINTDNVLTPRYIYQYVKQNRHNTHKILGIEDTAAMNASMESSIDASFEGRNGFTSPDCTNDFASPKLKGDAKSLVQPTKTFNVVFSSEEWHKIQPVEATYKRKDRTGVRVRQVLPQNYWASVIVSKLWESHKLPCPYSFTRGQVSCTEGTDYIKIFANCKECGASATGVILCVPVEGESVSLLWRAPDTRSVPHYSSRWLSGEVRKDVGVQLQRNCASAFQKGMAVDSMDHGDLKPPHLWSTVVLRKAKQEERAVGLNIKGHANPILNLLNMKHSPTYTGTIHDIGLDKFFLHYYTVAQMLLYKKHCASGYTKLSVDATGTLVKKINHTSLHKSGHIFLYEAVATTVATNKITNLPSCQMLSEKHDTNSIMFWLNEWRRAGAPKPNEVVIDNSAALKSAVTQVFAGVDLITYKKQCFEYLTGGSTVLPQCFIRLDVAHYINAACRWPMWAEKCNKKVKQFYMRCLGLLINADTFESFELLLRHVLTVALSPCEKDSAGKVLPMEESLAFLGRHMSVDNAIVPNSDEAEDVGRRLPDPANNMEVGSAIDTWPGSIKNSISIVDDPEGRPNPYYSPDVAKEFTRVASEFTLWSSVLTKGFGSPFKRGTSAPIESEFADLKCHILKGESKPLKVDTFVAIHIKAIEGACRLTDIKKDCFNVNRYKCSVETDDLIELEIGHKDNVEPIVEDLNQQENWRGLGEKNAKKRTRYLTALPGADIEIAEKKLKPATNRLLRNGTGRSVTSSDNTVLLIKNTCGYDSLCHLVANSYLTFESYRNQMAESQNGLIKTAVSLVHHGANVRTYKIRAETLAAVLEPMGQLNMPPTRRRTLALEYDAFGNISTLLKKVLEPHISLEVACQLSNHAWRSLVLDTNSIVLTDHGIQGLSQSLGQARRCDQCTLNYGDHIFIDVEYLSSIDFPRGNRSTARLYQLLEIPDLLLLGNQRYKLSGLVHYDSSHYIAYCVSSQIWTKFDDLCSKEANVRDTTKVWPSLLMYVKLRN